MGNYNKICILLALIIQYVAGQSIQRCTEPNYNRPGECRPINQCPHIQQLQGDSRYTDYITQSRYACGNYFSVVCCPIERQQRPQDSGNLPEPGKCGLISLKGRVVGGEPTDIYEHPWMAMIQYSKPGNRFGFHCGGSLINPYWVITAAHCIDNQNIEDRNWKVSGVRLGEWNITTNPDCNEEERCAPPVEDIRVVEQIVHENYARASKHQQNDIALLRLERPVTYTEFIKPICLPVSQKVIGRVYDGEPLMVAGWGKTENGVNSKIKLKAELDAMSMDRCNAVYSELNLTLIDKQLCAGGKKGIDSCQGDSGGPLMEFARSDDNRIMYQYIVGIVSFGRTPCAQPGWPGVYTRMDKYVDWVKSQIQN